VTNLQAEQAMGDTARVVGAFVTFRNESSRLDCLKATPHSWIKQWWTLKPAQKLRGRWAHCSTAAMAPKCKLYTF